MANRVGVNFATQSSNQLVVEPGVQTNADASGNAITYGGSLDRLPNDVQNIDASALVALPSVVTAKSITSTHETAQVTVRGVTIT